nr:DUF6678 family protein [Halomonas huangheensis]
MDLTPIMNSTKWNELRLAMYNLGDFSPRFRTRCIENGYLAPWDGEWFCHFRECGYEIIEWVEIETTSLEQDRAVLAELSAIHVPGEKIQNGYKIYGYARVGQFIDYI